MKIIIRNQNLGQLLLSVMLVLGGLTACNASEQATESQAKTQTTDVEWFHDAKFGMFIHWGNKIIRGVLRYFLVRRKVVCLSTITKVEVIFPYRQARVARNIDGFCTNNSSGFFLKRITQVFHIYFG